MRTKEGTRTIRKTEKKKQKKSITKKKKRQVSTSILIIMSQNTHTHTSYNAKNEKPKKTRTKREEKKNQRKNKRMKRRMTRQRERERERRQVSPLYLRVIFTKSLPLMVSMRSDARVPVSKYVCTRVRGAIPHMRACSVHRPMHDACTRSRERYGEGRMERRGGG